MCLENLTRQNYLTHILVQNLMNSKKNCDWRGQWVIVKFRQELENVKLTNLTVCVTHEIKIPQRSTLDRDANRTYAARNEESAYVPYCTVHWRHGKWVRRSLGLGQPVRRRRTEPCSPCCSIRRRGHSTVHSVLLRTVRDAQYCPFKTWRGQSEIFDSFRRRPPDSSCFRQIRLSHVSERAGNSSVSNRKRSPLGFSNYLVKSVVKLREENFQNPTNWTLSKWIGSSLSFRTFPGCFFTFKVK